MPFPAHYCCHFLHVPPSKDRPAVSATFHLPLTCLHLPFLACANVSVPVKVQASCAARTLLVLS